MKTNSLKIYLLVFAVLFSANLNAQRFDTLLKKLNIEYPQEKLYLQFDRSMYNPGETIWFKAYLFSGNFPSLISKTLYTELTDAEGMILQRVTIPVILSGASGSLEIPGDVKGPVYIRAYTKWMLNFDSSFLYTKAISIITPQKSFGKLPASSQTKENPVATSSSVAVQFFPEGGDLVEGVESRIAFKATDHSGMPMSVTGDIFDGKGKKITSFLSVHDGMGTFTFQPEAGELYKAIWKDPQNQTHETLLSPAKQNGIVLEANNLKDQIEFEIKRSSNATAYPFVYVVAVMHGQMIFKAKVSIEKTVSAIGLIPTANLPAGIVQLTVFNPGEQPLAERIIFANSSDYSFITNLEDSLTGMGKRKKNIIVINVPDTFSCNLSVAVTDADLNSMQAENNIYSTLLLTSDIKGYVYDPAYYFSSDADSVASHLDLVMMTNGWRRFKWEDVITGHFPALNYLPENYISAEGQVKGLNKTVLAGKEINGILELKSKSREYLNIPVQPDGTFSFSGMVFYDTAKLFYQFNNDKKKTLTSKAVFTIKSNLLKDPLRLQPNNFLLLDVTKPDTATLTKNTEVYQEHLSELELKKIKTLKTVVITGKIKSKQELMDEEYTTGFFSNDPSGNSRTILPEDDPAFLASQNLVSYLQGRIAGLQISISGTDASITWRGFPTSLFVNEITQTEISFETGKLTEDPSYILSIPMSEIAMVKIFDPPFFGAGSSSSGGEGGAIAVYLKKGNERNQMVRGLDYITLPGYSPIKEFYSPDYSMPVQSDVPDYRSTLYWNPFVVTDKNHRSFYVSFYNNDITKNMKVIIEGCNENGKLTRIEKILQ